MGFVAIGVPWGSILKVRKHQIKMSETSEMIQDSIL